MPRKSSKPDANFYPDSVLAEAVRVFAEAGHDVGFSGGELWAQASSEDDARDLFDELANYAAGLAADPT